MGYDLGREGLDDDRGGYFRYNIWGFGRVISFAEAFGFETDKHPTTIEQERLLDGLTWDGTWFTNDGQTVSTEAANALADALERGLAEDLANVPSEWHDTERREYCGKFIAWLRLGAFQIW